MLEAISRVSRRFANVEISACEVSTIVFVLSWRDLKINAPTRLILTARCRIVFPNASYRRDNYHDSSYFT
jgi:hypothetical protein